ncbi:hypothetical protein P872_01755 [Rhodonellum psychrophilum GCM71 = DSM 17998]|uniref:Uncharacterized protein n=1 Tax=Rhodonellum psychrophilum GCM71 = DSM 17998 TaxID=1123057 RepID=U5C1S0_9BACT|nr:hypothetical protein P872_01755 [Rhodonellum psychrophilum GCM71 = DSM 17998]
MYYVLPIIAKKNLFNPSFLILDELRERKLWWGNKNLF